MALEIRTATDGQRSAYAALPALLRNRDKERLDQYRTALAFYQGQQWPHVRTGVSRLRRLTVNYLRAITNKTASYVMKGATVSVHPRDDSNDATQAAAEAELALAEIAQANGLPRLDQATEIDTAVLGDGAFKVTWDVQEERVAITSPDMAGLFPWPHPTDPSRFHRLAHRYQLPAADAAAFWGLRTANDPAWIIEDWRDEALAIHIDDHPNPDLVMANPYGLIPYVIFPNEQVPKRWWGASDITPLTEIAEELNAEFSRLSNILELSGNPIAILEGVEQSQGIETFPGATWELPDGAKAYVLDLLQHGAVTMHLEYLQTLLRALHDLSETPRTAFGDNSRDLSGIALQVELQPLLQKVDRKRLIRSQAYDTRAGIALYLLDRFTGASHLQAGTILTSWEAPTPADRTREVADEITQVDGRIKSRRTAMADLGAIDPDAEWERIKAEAAELQSLTLVETRHGTV